MASILAFLFIGFLILLLTSNKKELTVVNYSWESTNNIEQEKTVRESDWSIPPDGRVLYTQEEVHHYDSVFSHYETVTVTKSQRVLDHYEVSHYYTDNGNGTFTEHQMSTPVYRTEYYTEDEQQPVYDQVPVYKTKYYYEIDQWFFDHKVTASAHNKEPYYPTDYTLADRQRDSDRHQDYFLYYDDNSMVNVSYDNWINVEIGDKKTIEINRSPIKQYKTRHF
jgi:hypothetical protein